MSEWKAFRRNEINGPPARTAEEPGPVVAVYNEAGEYMGAVWAEGIDPCGTPADLSSAYNDLLEQGFWG